MNQQLICRNKTNSKWINHLQEKFEMFSYANFVCAALLCSQKQIKRRTGEWDEMFNIFFCLITVILITAVIGNTTNDRTYYKRTRIIWVSFSCWIYTLLLQIFHVVKLHAITKRNVYGQWTKSRNVFTFQLWISAAFDRLNQLKLQFWS